MQRFNCPNCGKSLSFRLLPIVSSSSLPKDTALNTGVLFSCIHCGAVLTYSEPLFGLSSRLSRVFFFCSGLVVFSLVGAVFGQTTAFAAIGIVALVMAAILFLAPKPAYRVVSISESGDEDSL